MKKFVILSLLIAAIFVAKSQNSHSKRESSLLLYNIEALANNNEYIAVFCIGIGSLNCPASNDKVYRYYAY